MLLSKAREALIGIRAGRVTRAYPFGPSLPTAGFRGKNSIDPDLCFGCGGCANVCPAGVIAVADTKPQYRLLEFFWSRCTYCGSCEDACPEGAIRLTDQFETATNDAGDLYMRLEVFMGPCQRCGRCFHPATPLDRMMKTGFRNDAEGGRA